MEPGEKTILKQRPRPKDEPIVLGWMWMSIVMNAVVLSAVIIGVYVVALLHFCEGAVLQKEVLTMEDFEERLMDARTVAFVSLVFAENVRAYTSRSFGQPFWRNFLGNAQMQKAIVLAQLCLYSAVFIPGFSDKVLGLRGVDIGGWGWGVAMVGPVATLVLCEACKVITHHQMRLYQKNLSSASDEKCLQQTEAADKTSYITLDIAGAASEVVRHISSEIISKDSYGKLQ